MLVNLFGIYMSYKTEVIYGWMENSEIVCMCSCKSIYNVIKRINLIYKEKHLRVESWDSRNEMWKEKHCVINTIFFKSTCVCTNYKTSTSIHDSLLWKQSSAMYFHFIFIWQYISSKNMQHNNFPHKKRFIRSDECNKTSFTWMIFLLLFIFLYSVIHFISAAFFSIYVFLFYLFHFLTI